MLEWISGIENATWCIIYLLGSLFCIGLVLWAYRHQGNKTKE